MSKTLNFQRRLAALEERSSARVEAIWNRIIDRMADWLVAEYGADALDNLPEGVQERFFREHPDMWALAEQFVMLCGEEWLAKREAKEDLAHGQGS